MADNGNPETVVNASATGGQPVSQPQGGESAAQTQEQAPLTLAQVEQVVRNILGDSLADYGERQSRTLQSQLDKREAGITKRLREQLSQAEKFATLAKGRGIDEKEAAALQGALVNDALQAMLADEDDQDEGRGTSPRRGRAAQYDLDDVDEREAVTEQGRFVWEMSGLEQGDPEVASIATNGTPQQYLQSIYQAGIKKALRLQGGQQQAATQPPPPANAARIPALGADGSRAPTEEAWRQLHGSDLWKAAAEYERQKRQQS